MARMCCSNCEVTAPSIVQWPLLWTRGAISLTTGPSARREELDGEHADMAERLGDAQGRGARLVDLRRRLRSPQGTVERRRMPSRWSFSGQSQKAWRAVRPAREDDREFGVRKSIAASATAGSPPIASQAASASSRRADPGLALAVIAVAAGLEDERQAELGDRALRRPRAMRPRATARRARRSIR